MTAVGVSPVRDLLRLPHHDPPCTEAGHIVLRTEGRRTMEGNQFDSLVKSLSDGGSRRRVLRGLAAAGLAAVGLDQARAAAQDASPAAGAGPSLALVAHGIPTIAPGQDLGVIRITFPPGSTVPAHVHPGAMAFWVETGAVGWT